MSESTAITIVEFQPEHKQAFRDLNVEWISKYFKMEASDYKALDNPQENILDKGGYIAVALLDGVVVGVCGLMKMKEDDNYELVKMGVNPSIHGKGVGKQLGVHIINKARTMGAKRIYIESNRILVPAVSLYAKLGFVEVSGFESPYERCDIQMELILA
jgi:N-acetylglutamate synthase-like GNAT family acetyltransferase